MTDFASPLTPFHFHPERPRAASGRPARRDVLPTPFSAPTGVVLRVPPVERLLFAAERRPLRTHLLRLRGAGRRGGGGRGGGGGCGRPEERCCPISASRPFREDDSQSERLVMHGRPDGIWARANPPPPDLPARPSRFGCDGDVLSGVG